MIFLMFKVKIFIFSYYLCALQHGFIAFMVKKELTEAEIAESIPDLWQPLTETQRAYLAQNFTIQKYKKNEVIYCEGETPQYLMCERESENLQGWCGRTEPDYPCRKE